MNENIISSGITLLIASGLITWMLNQRRNRRLDSTAETKAETDTIVAIAAAAGQLTDATAILIHPLKERIEALEAAEKTHTKRLDNALGRIKRHEHLVNAFIAYVMALRGQLQASNIPPHDPPDELDGFQFD